MVRSKGYEVDGLQIRGDIQVDFYATKPVGQRKIYVAAPVLDDKGHKLLIRGEAYGNPLFDLHRGVHLVLHPPRQEESDLDQLFEAVSQQFPPLLLLKLFYRDVNKRREAL